MALSESQKKIALLNELSNKRRAYSGYNVAERHLSVVHETDGKPDMEQARNVSDPKPIKMSDKNPDSMKANGKIL